MRVLPLTPTSLASAERLLARACPLYPAAAVAEEKLFGPAPVPGISFGAYRGDELLGVAVAAGRWIRLLAVDPVYRRQGVGSALLDACREQARAAGAVTLRSCDQPGNYLTPGIDEQDTDTSSWLSRRGFRSVGKNQNLRVSLVSLPDAAVPPGYRIRAASPDDLAWVGARFSPAWGFELGLALPDRGYVAVDAGDRPCAFAAHDANNRGLGWFGPAGTLDEHRGKGLGRVLLLRCLRAISRRQDHAVIAWAGSLGFYTSTVGATVDRAYVVWETSLT